MKDKDIFPVWAQNQALGFSLGWGFHGVLSHLFTGEHGLQLSAAQLVMHTLSLLGMALIVLYFQHRATMRLFGFGLLQHWPPYLLGAVGLFWAGYYGLGAPVDLVLTFLGFAALNGLYLSRYLQLRRWMLLSLLAALVGLVAGTIVVAPLEPLVLPYVAGLTKHIIVFLVEGSAIGIPMALSGGLLLRKALSRSGTSSSLA